MNNAVYGKTMEDVRGHVDFELVGTPERMEKLLNAPTLKHRHILNENLVGVEKIKPVMKLNEPIYISVLASWNYLNFICTSIVTM